MRLWFYTQQGQQQGPIPEDNLVELFRSGQLPTETLVWTEGHAEWTAAREVENLVPASLSPPPRPAAQSEPPGYISNATSAQPSTHSIKKAPVILSIIFTFITAGIYFGELGSRL